MDWNTLREKIYYLDGSFRDIYVLNTTRKDWEEWIDMVNNNYCVKFYTEEMEEVKNAIDKSLVFDFWDKKTVLSNRVSIFLDSIVINCFFACEQEIDNDIIPKEINTIDDHDKLMNYLKNVSKTLDKQVVMTPESIYPNDNPNLIIVEKEETIINLEYGVENLDSKESEINPLSTQNQSDSLIKFKMWLKSNTYKQVKNFVAEAEKRNFVGIDWQYVKGDLAQHEYGLVLDIIAEQIYEYQSEIDEDFYKMICEVADLLGMKNSEYFFLQELIRSKNKIPLPVKSKVREILFLLENK